MLDSQLLAEINLLTFKELDRRKGFVPQLPDVPPTGPTYSDEWYASIYAIPFRDLPDEDITRICWQSWEKQIFVPLGLDRLRLHPFAGNGYDGQLLKVIGEETPKPFWREHPDMLHEFCSIINTALSMMGEDAEDLGLKPEYDQSVLIYEETRKEILHLQAILSCR